MTKKEGMTPDQEKEYDDLYDELYAQFKNNDFEGFLKNVDKARERGFISEKEYKRNMKMLRGMTSVYTARMKLSNKVKDIKETLFKKKET